MHLRSSEIQYLIPVIIIMVGLEGTILFSLAICSNYLLCMTILFSYNLSSEKIDKYVGSLETVNLWNNLVDYDELTINMRQQEDETCRNLLSRIRIGLLTKFIDNDILVVETLIKRIV